MSRLLREAPGDDGRGRPAGLVDAAAQQGVFLGVNYNRRFGFGYRTARRLVDEGRLGQMRCLVFQVFDRTPRPEVARVPEVILTTLLTHHLDLARWFGGEVALIATRFAAGRSGDGTLRQTVFLTFEFASGALGSIVAGYRDGQTRTIGASRPRRAALGSVQIDDVTRAAIYRSTDLDRLELFEPSPFTDEAGFITTIGDHLAGIPRLRVRGRAATGLGH